MVVNATKQTLDVARDVCFALGHVDAVKFFTTPLGCHGKYGCQYKDDGLGWSKEYSYAIDWHTLDATLNLNHQCIRCGWLSNHPDSAALR